MQKYAKKLLHPITLITARMQISHVKVPETAALKRGQNINRETVLFV